MDELYKSGLIKEPVYISTPINGVSPLDAVSTAKATKTLDKEELKLLQKLHLLRGNEKKEAMQKLGLGWKTEKQHGMQAAMKRAGFVGPGQKWWAIHSESTFARRLNTILEKH